MNESLSLSCPKIIVTFEYHRYRFLEARGFIVDTKIAALVTSNSFFNLLHFKLRSVIKIEKNGHLLELEFETNFNSIPH